MDGILTINTKKMVVKVLLLENTGDGSDDGYGKAKRRFNKKIKRDILSRSFFNFNFIIQHSDVYLKYDTDALFKGYSLFFDFLVFVG